MTFRVSDEKDEPVLRTGRVGRAHSAVAAVRGRAAALVGRLLVVAGLVAVGWLLGAAAASADTGGAVDSTASHPPGASASSSAKSDANTPATNQADTGADADTARDSADTSGDTPDGPSSSSPSAPSRDTGGTGDSASNAARSDAVRSTVDGVGERATHAVPATTRDVSSKGHDRAGDKGEDVASVVDKVGHAGKGAAGAAGTVTERGDLAGDRSTGHVNKRADPPGTDRLGPVVERKAPENEHTRVTDSPTAFLGAPNTGGHTPAPQPVQDSADDSPAKDTGPDHGPSPLGSAHHSQTSNPTPGFGFAGYLSGTHLSAPTPGPLHAARSALDVAPQGPLDEPTVSPD